jgi:hypothetical protein
MSASSANLLAEKESEITSHRFPFNMPAQNRSAFNWRVQAESLIEQFSSVSAIQQFANNGHPDARLQSGMKENRTFAKLCFISHGIPPAPAMQSASIAAHQNP